MKINNPTKYYPEGGESSWNMNNLAAVKNNATLVSRGDIIKKFADQDYLADASWHFEEDPKTDSWVKFSFDGGLSWPLKFRYKNTLLMKVYKDDFVPTRGEKFSFDFGSSSAVDYASIRNGRLSLYFIDSEGYAINTPFYGYKFDDDTATLNMYVTITPPINAVKTMLLVELDGHSAMAMAVPTPVYSNDVLISEMEQTELGLVKLLKRTTNDDAERQAVSANSLDGVSEITLKLIAADGSGDVHLRVSFSDSQDETNVVVHVDNEGPTYETIAFTRRMSGILTIKRIVDSSDTLNADCYLQNVKVVSYA